MDFSILQNFTIQCSEHWGPSELNKEEYANLPISFFNRFEKIGRCCDPTLLLHKRQDDQNEFIVVEGTTKKVQKNTVTIKSKVHYAPKSQQANRYPTNNKFYKRNKITYKTKMKEPVTVKNDWIQEDDVYKPAFQDLIVKVPPNITEIKEVGVLKELNPVIEKVQRRQYRLEYENAQIEPSSTISDDVFRYLLEERDKKSEEERKTKRVVFACENFVTAMMVTKVSQYPWHIKVDKLDNVLIIDNYDEAATYLDMFTTNENTQNNMPQEENKIVESCIKATNATKSFKKQLASGKAQYTCDEASEDQPYTRYVKIQLGKNMELYTRVNIDGVKTDEEGLIESYLIRSLFETETVYEWKKKFETSPGEVISQEYLANTSNWQKWLIEGEMANVRNYKIGYLSETKEPGKYSILNVMEINSKDIEKNISFKIADVWPVLQSILQNIYKYDDGEYLLVKSPFQHNIKLYRIPKEEDEKPQLEWESEPESKSKSKLESKSEQESEPKSEPKSEPTPKPEPQNK